uniref:hypothetical protein n=1 Tax=Nonomuraea pusilla TaxID=46177 RepID=UPI000A478DA2|nr:hypothetical protein [Nonomuraea pusilla]
MDGSGQVIEVLGDIYRPVPLALCGAGFAALAFGLRRTWPSARFLLLPAVAWLLAAAEEWYVRTYQPHMNIRVDLLFFMVLLTSVTLAGILLTVLYRRPPRP